MVLGSREITHLNMRYAFNALSDEFFDYFSFNHDDVARQSDPSMSTDLCMFCRFVLDVAAKARG